MPGSLELLTRGAASGWARHPRHPMYPMLVHVLAQGRVVASGLAAIARPDGNFGFTLTLPRKIPIAELQVMLGETDEYLALPASRSNPPPAAPGLLTVEDLIGIPTRRPWVNGDCHIDAERCGLLPETIIDMLCRDYLGRPAGAVTIAAGLQCLAAGGTAGGYDAIRRGYLAGEAYRARRIYADTAPGAIFSQSMILSVAAADFRDAALAADAVTSVSALPLLALEGRAFLAACYQQILRKALDAEGEAYYLGKLADGMTKQDVIRQLGDEFEATNVGILIEDLPPE